MAVLGMVSVALEVPDLQVGISFYTDAGLIASAGENAVSLRCDGQRHTSILLLKGNAKRLHHVTLEADRLDALARAVPLHGGRMEAAPGWADGRGIWVRDPHGMLIHLVERDEVPPPAEAPLFEINAPGRIVRKSRSAVLPVGSYGPVKPLRLGHVLVFSPDVSVSVDFVTNALGMGLADRAQDVIAFCCARRNSDHHVLAFAKSPAVGFHHASFEVNDPDEVGRGGRALAERAGKGEWGFGRHTIGSNFFHYIQDPWGSWFEYFSDMDHIEDHSLWTPTDYDLADSLANWGPAVPDDFVHNYEAA